MVPLLQYVDPAEVCDDSIFSPYMYSSYKWDEMWKSDDSVDHSKETFDMPDDCGEANAFNAFLPAPDSISESSSFRSSNCSSPVPVLTITTDNCASSVTSVSGDDHEVSDADCEDYSDDEDEYQTFPIAPLPKRVCSVPNSKTVAPQLNTTKAVRKTRKASPSPSVSDSGYESYTSASSHSASSHSKRAYDEDDAESEYSADSDSDFDEDEYKPIRSSRSSRSSSKRRRTSSPPPEGQSSLGQISVHDLPPPTDGKYQCPVPGCPQICNAKGDFVRHLMKKGHPNAQPHECACGDTFTRKDALNRHIRDSCVLTHPNSRKRKVSDKARPKRK
jgi:hypothetical protein